MEEGPQIVVGDDCLGDRQQGSVLLAGGKLRAVWCEVTHGSRHPEPPRAAKGRETKPRERSRAFGPGGWRAYSTRGCSPVPQGRPVSRGGPGSRLTVTARPRFDWYDSSWHLPLLASARPSGRWREPFLLGP